MTLKITNVGFIVSMHIIPNSEHSSDWLLRFPKKRNALQDMLLVMNEIMKANVQYYASCAVKLHQLLSWLGKIKCLKALLYIGQLHVLA